MSRFGGDNRLTGLYVELEARDKGLGKQLDSVNARVGKVGQGLEKLSAGFAKLAVPIAVVAAIDAVISRIVKAIDTTEQLRESMKGIGGSASDAAEQIRNQTNGMTEQQAQLLAALKQNQAEQQQVIDLVQQETKARETLGGFVSKVLIGQSSINDVVEEGEAKLDKLTGQYRKLLEAQEKAAELQEKQLRLTNERLAREAEDSTIASRNAELDALFEKIEDLADKGSPAAIINRNVQREVREFEDRIDEITKEGGPMATQLISVLRTGIEAVVRDGEQQLAELNRSRLEDERRMRLDIVREENEARLQGIREAAAEFDRITSPNDQVVSAIKSLERTIQAQPRQGINRT